MLDTKEKQALQGSVVVMKCVDTYGSIDTVSDSIFVVVSQGLKVWVFEGLYARLKDNTSPFDLGVWKVKNIK